MITGPEAPAVIARLRASRYFNELRLATYTLVLFAAGHPFGAVVNTPRFRTCGHALSGTAERQQHALASTRRMDLRTA